MKTVRLKKGKEKFTFKKHPWIFSGALRQEDEMPDAGDAVRVLDYRDRFVAMGHYYPASIAVRILSFEDVPLDNLFFRQKIERAWTLRNGLDLTKSEETNVFRLVNAEGDGLPGLIADYYNGVLVVAFAGAGMRKESEKVREAFQAVLGEQLVAVYQKDEEGRGKYVYGKAGVPHRVKEYGHTFLIDWEHGQKTGFFIDQRENRLKAGQDANDRTVLNAFSYTGAFSVYALQGNAKRVDSVDASKAAIQLAEENVKLNGGSDRHRGIAGDVFEHLKEHPDEYDMIILDPPAFAKNISKRHNAVIGYKRLNALAMKNIRKAGYLFTFSCSQVVNTLLFEDTIRAAAIESGREIQVLDHLTQAPDHPVNIYHPEGHYLKGMILRVI